MEPVTLAAFIDELEKIAIPMGAQGTQRAVGLLERATEGLGGLFRAEPVVGATQAVTKVAPKVTKPAAGVVQAAPKSWTAGLQATTPAMARDAALRSQYRAAAGVY